MQIPSLKKLQVSIIYICIMSIFSGKIPNMNVLFVIALVFVSKCYIWSELMSHFRFVIAFWYRNAISGMT